MGPIRGSPSDGCRRLRPLFASGRSEPSPSCRATTSRFLKRTMPARCSTLEQALHRKNTWDKEGRVWLLDCIMPTLALPAQLLPPQKSIKSKWKGQHDPPGLPVEPARPLWRHPAATPAPAAAPARRSPRQRSLLPPEPHYDALFSPSITPIRGRGALQRLREAQGCSEGLHPESNAGGVLHSAAAPGGCSSTRPGGLSPPLLPQISRRSRRVLRCGVFSRSASADRVAPPPAPGRCCAGSAGKRRVRGRERARRRVGAVLSVRLGALPSARGTTPAAPRGRRWRWAQTSRLPPPALRHAPMLRSRVVQRGLDHPPPRIEDCA